MSSKDFQPGSQQSQPERTQQPDGRYNNRATVTQPVAQQSAPSVPHAANNRRSSQDYRQNRVDRVSGLLKERYRRISSETNSRLLFDMHTGEVLPEVVDAIAVPIATDYRRAFNGEVPKADITRAFGHFGQSIEEWSVQVSFGRAGYNRDSRQRFIDVGPSCYLTFELGASWYCTNFFQPLIRPSQSRPFHQPGNIGNRHPTLVNQLFERTALAAESDLLLLAWIILSWMPDRSQVMLELLGPPSSALAQAHAVVKNLVDPSTVDWENDLPSNRKQFDDLALKHYLLSFNQVEVLTSTQQKHILSLMRGKSLQWKWKGKKLDVEVTVQCPVILNSLESVATMPKLADATLSLEVEQTVDTQHTASVQASSMEPAIQIGLVMVFGYVNGYWARVEYDARFDAYHSLADLCRVGELVAECLGRDKSEFWRQFKANQQSRREFELEESPIALAVQRLLHDEKECVIDIPVKEWLVRLEPYRPEDATPGQWPASSRQLGAAFKSIIPLMRDIGITLTSVGKRGPLCFWRAEKLEESSELKESQEPDEFEEREKRQEPDKCVQLDESDKSVKIQEPQEPQEPIKPEELKESKKPVEFGEREELEGRFENRMRVRKKW